MGTRKAQSMKLKIENIGMIRSADIKLDGLTVIAGENDTGKSTVGKLIFSVVKAFNRYEEDLNESRYSRVLDLIEKIYFQLRKIYNFEKYTELQEQFNPKFFFKEIKEKKGAGINGVIGDKIVLLEEFNDVESIESLYMIRDILNKDEDKNITIKRALTKAFISEFYFDLSPKNSDVDSLINVSEGFNNILDILLNDNEIKSLSLHDDLQFNDVTFIETPIFLQMYDLIRSASTLFEMPEGKNERMVKMGRPKVALHTKDLISKLDSAQYDDLFQRTLFSLDGVTETSLIEDIFEITQGKGFSFDRKEKDFYYHKKENTKFKSINTATGLKSFGIIQLLIQSNLLDERSLLIIDEPEIHLHPKWQVEYAKLIVALVKNDIPVLITSHSPEIIQALSVFSEEFGIQDRTAFYLTESDGVSSQINDVTDDINKIFTTLAEPLHNLVWG